MWGATLRRRLREACRIMVDNSSHTSPYRAEAWHPRARQAFRATFRRSFYIQRPPAGRLSSGDVNKPPPPVCAKQ